MIENNSNAQTDTKIKTKSSSNRKISSDYQKFGRITTCLAYEVLRIKKKKRLVQENKVYEERAQQHELKKERKKKPLQNRNPNPRLRRGVGEKENEEIRRIQKKRKKKKKKENLKTRKGRFFFSKYAAFSMGP